MEAKQIILGSRGSVYTHVDEVLQWLGVGDKATRKGVVRELALHGARTAAAVMRTCAKLDLEEEKDGQGRPQRTDGGARG